MSKQTAGFSFPSSSGSGSGGGGGVTEVNIADEALGTHIASDSSFTVYTVASVAARGIVTRMIVTADTAGDFDIEVRADDSAGDLKYQAIGITSLSCDVQIPFSWKAASGDSFYIYIKNNAASSRTFTLTTLDVERFA